MQRAGFFDDLPRSPSRRLEGSPWDRTTAEFPSVAVSSLLLARTEAVAVAITAIWAYKIGFEFWIGAQFRHPGDAAANHTADQSLHLGLQFADGRKAGNIGRAPEPAGSVAAGLILSPLSFGGGRFQKNRCYWVWPLPPPGPLTFFCEWAAFSIPEQHTEVEAQLILDASKRSYEIWPSHNPEPGKS
jgi:hypothetical protein